MTLVHLPSAVLVLALALILVIAPLTSALLAKRAKHGERAKHARYARSMLILWAMTWLAIYALSLWGQRPADVGWRAPTEPALVPYLYVFVFIAVLAIAALRRPRLPDAQYSERIRLIAPMTRSDWAWFVPVAISAGICEEFLYRGYALHVVGQLTHSIFLGVVFSTAAFGLAHLYQGWRGVVGTTVFGLFFALIVVFFQSLWPCMIAHALQDLIGGAIVSKRLRAMPPPHGPAEQAMQPPSEPAQSAPDAAPTS
jgi:membrane protease YdiL (CAAX protease family)